MRIEKSTMVYDKKDVQDWMGGWEHLISFGCEHEIRLSGLKGHLLLYGAHPPYWDLPQPHDLIVDSWYPGKIPDLQPCTLQLLLWWGCRFELASLFSWIEEKNQQLFSFQRRADSLLPAIPWKLDRARLREFPSQIQIIFSTFLSAATFFNNFPLGKFPLLPKLSKWCSRFSISPSNVQIYIMLYNAYSTVLHNSITWIRERFALLVYSWGPLGLLKNL